MATKKITEVSASASVKDAASVLITQEDNNNVETLYRAPLSQILPKMEKKGSITFGTTWSGSDSYTQTVTVTGASVGSKSKVDLQPDATALAQLASDGITALYISNNAGTLTAYAIGGSISVSTTVQCTVSEVEE